MITLQDSDFGDIITLSSSGMGTLGMCRPVSGIAARAALPFLIWRGVVFKVATPFGPVDTSRDNGNDGGRGGDGAEFCPAWEESRLGWSWLVAGLGWKDGGWARLGASVLGGGANENGWGTAVGWWICQKYPTIWCRRGNVLSSSDQPRAIYPCVVPLLI